MPATKRKTEAEAKRETGVQQALQLRQSNVSYRRIAQELDIAVVTAHRWVQEGMVELHKQTIAEAGKLQSLIAARLDDVSRRAYSMLAPRPVEVGPGQVVNVPPDPDVVFKALLRIEHTEMERAKLFGVIAPQRFELDVPVGEDEVTPMVRAELAAMSAEDIDAHLASFQAGMAAVEDAKKPGAKRRSRAKPKAKETAT